MTKSEPYILDVIPECYYVLPTPPCQAMFLAFTLPPYGSLTYSVLPFKPFFSPPPLTSASYRYSLFPLLYPTSAYIHDQASSIVAPEPQQQ